MLAEQLGTTLGTTDEIVYRDAVDHSAQKIIVIGSGPVGMRVAEEIFKLDKNANVLVFGNEPSAPYNRVQLTALLAGQVARDDIDIPMPKTETNPWFEYKVAAIQSINRSAKVVIDSFGNVYHYDRLVIATGARAHIPNIPGIETPGVYQFRRLSDAEALFARVTRSRHVVVVGGGLLGIEAAKALARAGTMVTIIQQGPRLMNRQLDETAASLLEEDVKKMGIGIITQSGVREIQGKSFVTGVKTRSGQMVLCDTVVMCAGIQANKELALKARLPVGQGIVVDDLMRTSDPNVFAVGECCEHRGVLYGLVQPGFEQAAVVASVICSKTASYAGSQAVSRLKVVGKTVCSMGDVADVQKQPFQSVWHYQRKRDGIYRKLVLYKGQLVGALGYGDWNESSRVQRAFQSETYLWPWQRALFTLTGKLWIGSDSASVQQWPDKEIVCQCKQVTKGEILKARLEVGQFDPLKVEADSLPTPLEAVQKACGASTVCGTCKPLVAELVDSNAKPEKETAWSALLIGCLLALLVGALVAFSPEAKVSDSVLTQDWFEGFWNDKFWKQVTGFSLLGMTVVGLLMSLRKRFNVEWMGRFAYWRLLHVVLGLMCVATLILHTGFHLGENLNHWLMLDFLLLIGMGASAGIVIALSHHFKPMQAQRIRKFWTWMHVLVTWPLPALLAAHILSVYYF